MLLQCGEMSWPTPKSVAQTVVTSQIAFVVIFIFFIVFDAVLFTVVYLHARGEQSAASSTKKKKR